MQKQGGRYWTYPTKPSSLFLSHLHWKDCRVRVKAEAYELHGTVWAPLSQFILPHVSEHVRALSKGKANGSLCPHSHILAAVHNMDIETWVNTQLWCMVMCDMMFYMLNGLLPAWVDQFSPFIYEYIKAAAILTKMQFDFLCKACI